MGNSATRSDHGSGQDATGRLLHAYHAEGDADARTRLIELYLPLVHTLARRHARRGELYEDLVQVGSIGLIKAIDRFDVARGGELAAFAVPNIAGEMKRHLRDSGTIRLPRGLAELRGRLSAARDGAHRPARARAHHRRACRRAGRGRGRARECPGRPAGPGGRRI